MEEGEVVQIAAPAQFSLPLDTVVGPLGGSGGLTVTRPARLVVLVSGGGSNLAALLEACQDPGYGAQVVAVVADREGTGGVELARAAGIDTAVFEVSAHSSRTEWDGQLAKYCQGFAPDLVISAGFLKILGPQFLAAFEHRIINTHNSLLPAFPGIHGPAEALAAGVKLAGATLFVVDPGMDTGPILAQVAVPVEESDTVESLLERIKVAERAQLVESVGHMVKEGWRITPRGAFFG